MPRNTSGGDRHVAVQTAANQYLIAWMHDELPQVILGGQAAIGHSYKNYNTQRLRRKLNHLSELLGEQFTWQGLEKSCTSSSQVIPEPHALLKPVQTPNCRTTRAARRPAGTGESGQVAPPLRVMVTTFPAVFPSFFPPSFIPCSRETNAHGQSVGERATTLRIKCELWYRYDMICSGVM